MCIFNGLEGMKTFERVPLIRAVSLNSAHMLLAPAQQLGGVTVFPAAKSMDFYAHIVRWTLNPRHDQNPSAKTGRRESEA